MERHEPVAVVHVDRLWQRPPLTAAMATADTWAQAAWQLSDQAARPIQDFEEPCLVLLGEPGSGKSTVVQRYADSLRREGGAKDVLRAELGSYGSEQRLFDDVLRSDQIQEWIGGDHALHLFLDGLDEGLRLGPSLAKALPSELESWPLDRLRLVITCRSADWPTSLEGRLKELIEAVGLYTILPLEQQDVVLIAERNGVGGQEFAAALSAAGVWDLARIPLTLRLLIGIHRTEGELPSDQAQLFARGLAELCHEHDGLRPRPSSSQEERLLVAERLAAITVFGGLTGFVRDSHDRADRGEGLAAPIDCAGGEETREGSRVVVDRAVVEDTLGTGLFAARGSGVLGWAHQRFAEFLAARFLQRRQVESTQLRNLVLSGDGTGIPPQTRAVAVWLAALGTPIADAIIAADPEAFVSSGVVLPDDGTRAAVTRALLDAAAEERLGDPFRRSYEGLARPGLADQLAPLLSDAGSDSPERQVAVEIAADCHIGEVLPALLAIALSAQEPHQLRASAALGVARSEDQALAPQLLPLARGEAGDDPYDELRGAALRALWPDHLDVEELIECLRRPARDNFIGSYKTFLSGFLDDLGDEDLPTVLRWAAAYAADHAASRRALGYAMLRLIGQLAQRALRRIDEDETVSALVRLAWTLRHSGERLLPDNVVLDSHARRRLILVALDHLGGHADDVYDVPQLVGGHTLLDADDLRWLCNLHAEAETGERRSAVARLMGWVFNPENPQHRELAFEVASAREHEEHAAALYDELFAHRIEPVDLGSDRAVEMRENHRLVHGDPQARDDAMTVQEVRDRVLELLQAAEQGDMDAYWRCDQWMTVEPGDHPHYKDFSDDLTEQPVWAHLDEDEQQRVITAACRYLLEGDPDADRWLGTNTLYFPAMAGYRAAFLLYKQAPELLDGLADELWGRWAPIIYNSPVTSDEGNAAVKRALLRRAYDVAPDAVLKAVEADLGREQRAEQGLFASEFLDAIWDRHLGDHIAAWSEREEPEGRLADDLLELLVRNEHPRGIELARADLNGRDRMADDNAAARAVRVLLAHSAAAHWPEVRQAIEQDAAFGKRVMAQLSFQAWNGLLSLEPQEVALLYEWLVRMFPPVEDPVHDSDGLRAVTAREEVGRWRDRLPMALARRGTGEALAALRGLVERRDRPLLRHHLREAEEAALERSWTPVPPQGLLQLVERAEARVVRTGDDLLAVVEESLLRYQDRLKTGHAAAYLWDERAEGSRPKSEQRLSQHLADHLKDDLRVVVNREVEVHPPPTGRGLGPRTDLKIDALSPTGEPLSVIVEVKGAWNQEVVDAIQSQLVDKYLDASTTRHGLYVAFWFDPQGWDPQHSARHAAAQWTRDGLEATLTERAAALTTDGRSVAAHVLDATIPGAV